MTLTERAVSRPVTTCMVFVAVLVLGLVSLSKLAVDLFPEIDFPSISVFTTYEGVGPEEIETLITRPIEQAVSRVQGIDRIESFSTEGRSRVQLRFTWGVNLDTAMNDTRAAVERVRDDLPEEAATPIVFKFDLSSFPVMMLTLSGDMSSWQLRQLAEETLSYRLERVEGVAAIDVRGGLKREIHVDLDAEKLSARGVTPAQVAEALRRENVNLPAGDVKEHGHDVIVRTLGEFESVEPIANVVVTTYEGSPVRVRDIGVVEDSHEDSTTLVLIDGKPGLRMSVSKLSGSNTVEVARRVKKEVAQINQEMPEIQLRAQFDTSSYIEDSINNVEQGLFFGVGLAILILFFFLQSVRSTAIVAAAIPIAGIGTFVLMYLGDFTLNMITFGGLALAIGLLVDNSIVILENIQRHQELGSKPKPAAIKGSHEVATAITASTMTTLCIFVPVVFVSGFAGIFFSQMAYVVSFGLLCSLGVALTLVPVFASFMPTQKKVSHTTQTDTDQTSSIQAYCKACLIRAETAYIRFLRSALDSRKKVYMVATALFFVSLGLFPFVGKELMPEGDQGELQIRMKLPVGTPLEKTQSLVREVDKLIRTHVPETQAVMGISGPPGFWSSDGPNNATLRVALGDKSTRNRSADEIAQVVRKLLQNIPDLKAYVRAGERLWILRMLRGGGERLAVEIYGHDTAIATNLAKEVMEAISTVDGITDVDSDREEGNREAIIRIDPDKASHLGLSVGSIGETISAYVLGKAATYYREGGDEFRVLVQLEENERRHAKQLESLPLLTPSGKCIMLGDVSKIIRQEGPITIRRLNQERLVTVSAGFADRDLGAVISDVKNKLSRISRPKGFRIGMAGEFTEQGSAFGELLLGLLLALVLVYMVMASLFESLLHPFVMLFSIPFAIVGVMFTLLLTGTTLNVNSFLGIIVLIGVVVNNAIVLIDYVNLLRQEHHMDAHAAVIEAGRKRLRPILMTTLTTSLALLPVALGLGEGGELQSPLARVVVGGLLVSTLITLVFVPSFYLTVDAWSKKFMGRSKSRIGST